MKCPKCGAEVKEGLAACSVCFAPLTGEEAERVARLAKEAPQITPRTQRKAESAPRSSGGGKAVAVILVIILLAAAGAGGWYYFIYMRSPQYAARQFLDGIKNKNYQQVYDYGLWTGVLGYIRSADDVRRAFDIAAQLGMNQTFDTYTIKKVTVNGDRATVSVTITQAGKTGDTDFVFVKTSDGKWKCDLMNTIKSDIEKLMRNMRIPQFNMGR